MGVKWQSTTPPRQHPPPTSLTTIPLTCSATCPHATRIPNFPPLPLPTKGIPSRRKSERRQAQRTPQPSMPADSPAINSFSAIDLVTTRLQPFSVVNRNCVCSPHAFPSRIAFSNQHGSCWLRPEKLMPSSFFRISNTGLIKYRRSASRRSLFWHSSSYTTSRVWALRHVPPARAKCTPIGFLFENSLAMAIDDRATFVLAVVLRR